MTEKQTIAAFDFDGTITYYDVLLSFFSFMAGPLKTFGCVLYELPRLSGVPLGYVTRQEAKEALLKHFIKGMNEHTLRTLGEEFALGPMHKLINPRALEKLRWHQKQGHTCILVSANLDVFLEPWSKKEGFEHILCSQVDIDSQGKATGKLKGLNCRGTVKTERLVALLGPRTNYTLYAYGDSPGDKELLAMADFPYYRKFD